MTDEKDTETLNKRYADIFNRLNTYKRIKLFRGFSQTSDVDGLLDYEKSTGGETSLSNLYHYIKDFKDCGIIESMGPRTFKLTQVGESLIHAFLDPESESSKIYLGKNEDPFKENIEKSLEGLSKEDAKRIIKKLKNKYDK